MHSCRAWPCTLLADLRKEGFFMRAGATCREAQEPAVDEDSAKVIGQRFGFEGLPKLLSRMLKGMQKQT